MFRSQNLQRRSNGIYYFRFHVPTKLLARFNCREIVRSLKTRDRHEAERRLTFERVRVYRLIDMTRNLSELSQSELEGAAIRYFHSASKQAEAKRLATKLREGEVEHELAVYADLTEMVKRDLEQNRFGHIAENIQEICDSEQIINEPDTDNYRALGHLTLRALLQIQEIFYSRTAGKYDAKPTDPLFIQKAPNGVAVRQAETSGANEEISIGTLRDRFLDHHKDIWAEKTVEKYTANLAICCQVIGADTPVRQITKANIRALRDTLAWLLANFAKRYPNSSIRVLVNTARRMNRAGMSPSTVNSYLGSLSSAFSWAGPEGYADSNPVLGITVPDPVHAADKRSPFSPSHLQAIFDAPTYRGMRSAHYWKTSGDQIVRDAKYWLPLVALFTGMRLGELVALRGQHFLCEDDHFYFNITKAKTRSGIRKVPLHPFLRASGFQAHIENTAADSPVFEGASQKPYSKHFRRFLDSVGITDPALVFHSFRHTFTDALRRARVEEPLAKALLGHSEGSVTGQYGAGYPLSALSAAMGQIEYPGLNLERLIRGFRPSNPVI